MRAWSEAAENKLRALYATTPLSVLAFQLKRTETAVRSRAKVLGLRRANGKVQWTRAMDAKLRRLYPEQSAQECAAALGISQSAVNNRVSKLGLSKASEWVSKRARQRWSEGRHEGSRAGCFKPGQEPPNKGLRRPGWAPGRMAQTQFRKGSMSGAAQHNYVPVGTERFDTKRGVVIRKLTDDQNIYPAARWRPVHVLVWEAANGPVPPGLVCVFRPGMKVRESARITVDRLELVTRAELMRRNTRHNYPPELNQLYALKAALTRKINHRTKHQGEVA